MNELSRTSSHDNDDKKPASTADVVRDLGGLKAPDISSTQALDEIPSPLFGATRPLDEKERLAELHSLDILDTPPEERFDRYTRLMAEIFKVPMVAVSLVDEDRQWFKSSVGLEVPETPLEESFCIHAIQHDLLLEVPDALEDDVFRDHPVVVGEPFIRFYAGVVLHGPTGQPLGTLCIMDTRSRYLTEEQRSWLMTLGHLVEKACMSSATRQRKRRCVDTRSNSFWNRHCSKIA